MRRIRRQTDTFIGEMIKNVMAEKQVTKAELARRLGVRPQSVEYLLKRKSIDTDTMYNVSVALEHDFSQLYSLKKDQTFFDKIDFYKAPQKAKVVIEIELEEGDLQKLDLSKKMKELLRSE